MSLAVRAIILVGVASMAAAAQRLDGCLAGQTQTAGLGVPDQTRDELLKKAGYSLSTDSLLVALKDPRPDVRSLAAGRLAGGATARIAPALIEALSAEHDKCTRGWITSALVAFERASSQSSQSAGRQLRPAPFQQCQPSLPRVLSLTLAESQQPKQPVGEPIVQVSVRNLTDRVIPFLKQGSPADTFSVSVLDPLGNHAQVPKEKEYLYHPLPPDAIVGRSGPREPTLGPGEEASWSWRVGEDFEMSAPGAYKVTLGGTLPYLGTTVCSNTLEITIPDRR